MSLALRRTRAEQAFRERQEKAIERERLHAMGEMPGGIAHDTNNALMPIVSYIELPLIDEEGITDSGRE